MKKIISVITLFIVTAMFVSVAYAMDYKLEQVVVLSRHNLRNSLKAGDDRGLLTRRGGEMETLMGQYFEVDLQKAGLFKKNAQPLPLEVRFYANSYQRTIATAKYFSAGAFPIANIPIEFHRALNQKDRVFFPETDAGLIKKLSVECDLRKITDKYKKEIATVERLTGLKYNPADSKAAIRKEVVEWKLSGSLGKLSTEADAILMDYYEGKVKYSDEEMRDVANVASIMINSNFDRPLSSKAFATSIIATISDELETAGRKFTFICGHDSTISTVLTALNVEDYVLPKTIEAKIPIGSKFIVKKFKGADGEKYVALSLIYPSTKQIINREMLTEENPPVIVPLKLRGLTVVDSSYGSVYKLSDALKRMSDARIMDGRRLAN